MLQCSKFDREYEELTRELHLKNVRLQTLKRDIAKLKKRQHNMKFGATRRTMYQNIITETNIADLIHRQQPLLLKSLYRQLQLNYRMAPSDVLKTATDIIKRVAMVDNKKVFAKKNLLCQSTVSRDGKEAGMLRLYKDELIWCSRMTGHEAAPDVVLHMDEVAQISRSFITPEQASLGAVTATTGALLAGVSYVSPCERIATLDAASGVEAAVTTCDGDVIRFVFELEPDHDANVSAMATFTSTLALLIEAEAAQFRS